MTKSAWAARLRMRNVELEADGVVGEVAAEDLAEDGAVAAEEEPVDVARRARPAQQRLSR